VPAHFQLALLGALPAVLAMMLFDRLDAKRPEPRSTLRMVALAGGVSAIPVILIELALKLFGPGDLDALESGAPSSYGAGLYMAFIVAAAPEEAAKMVSMLLFAWRRPEFDERMDGIVYGARAGLGFALVENVGYLLTLPTNLGEYVALFLGRAVLAVPGHAIWGAVIGYFAAVRRFDNRGPGLIGGYLLAVAMHGAYDAWLFCAPTAIADGHTWMSLGIAGFPVVAYSVPFAIVGGGALFVRAAMVRALADDDHAELLANQALLYQQQQAWYAQQQAYAEQQAWYAQQQAYAEQQARQAQQQQAYPQPQPPPPQWPPGGSGS
jgi:protease PrsW